MTVCPKCGRRLLSHCSARCNWCGEEITDPNYVAAAEVNRASFMMQDRMEAAFESARADALGPIYGSGLLGSLIPGGSRLGPRFDPQAPIFTGLPNGFGGLNNPTTMPTDVMPKPQPEQETDSEDAAPTVEEQVADRARHIEF